MTVAFLPLLLLSLFGFEEVGRLPLGRTLAVALQGGRIFYGMGGMLRVLDMESGEVRREAKIGGVILDIKPWGDSLLLACGPEGMKVVRASDLKVVGRFEGTAPSMTLRPPLVFVSGGRDGVKILDISHLEKPRQVGKLETEGEARSVFVG